MEIIFEVVNRAGRTLERHRAEGDQLSIGRAFDNALILSDETVSPHHALLETNADGVVMLRNLNSLNGVRTDRHERIDEPTELRSGGEYSFGRARVRIYSAAHAVSKTVRIGGLDWLVNSLGNRPVLAIVVSLVAGVAFTEQWLNTYSVIRWQQMGIGVFGVMTVGVVIAMLWAIVGRIVKHEGRFKTQLALVLLYILAQSVIYFGYELLLFNTLNTTISTAFSLLLSFLLLSSLFWLCLHIATNQDSAQRWKFAAAISSVFLCLSIYPEILKQVEFSISPQYIKAVKPPALRFTDGNTLEGFLVKSSALFGQTNHDDGA
jgi:hypothetical protein